MTYKIIDFELKGNQVRFYLGENGKQWGDDWNDTPYESNAGSVYSEFVKDTAVVTFDFDDIVLEPSDGVMNSQYCKEDMIKQEVPCIVVIRKDEFEGPGDSSRWEYEGDFQKALAHPHAKKYYFGEPIVAMR